VKTVNKKTGENTYYHHVLGAALVHPNQTVVIPLAPEPIVKGDGDTKNDYERNLSKRLLSDLRHEHPHLKILIVEDALIANYSHLSLIDLLNMAYVIGVKPGDHKYLFEWIGNLKANEHTVTDKDGTGHHFTYYHDVPLNDTHYDYRVNVIEYRKTKSDGKQQAFSWITRIKITNENIYQLMRAGKARWKIENETFNTLKNQGYNFDHNYRHGYQNLCSVMTMLMLLAFLIDQTQELCCKLYGKVRGKLRTWSNLFLNIRSMMQNFVWDDWGMLYEKLSWKDGHPPLKRLVKMIYEY